MRPHKQSISPCIECPYRKDDFCSQFNKKLEEELVELDKAYCYTISSKEYMPCAACYREIRIENGENPPPPWFYYRHRRRSK